MCTSHCNVLIEYYIIIVQYYQIASAAGRGSGPVSYTHLDVYKRQPLNTAAARRALYFVIGDSAVVIIYAVCNVFKEYKFT